MPELGSSSASRSVLTTCTVEGCNGVHFVDTGLLRKVHDQIITDPSSWNQATWALIKSIVTKKLRNSKGQFSGVSTEVCKTAYCVAGWATEMAGGVISFNRIIKGDRLVVGGDAQSCYGHDGKFYTIREYAMHALGLDHRESCLLFDGGNDLHMVEHNMKRIMERAGDKL